MAILPIKTEKWDWLSGHTPDADDMTSYSEFIKDIDTVVMGYNTYHQIVTELSPGLAVHRPHHLCPDPEVFLRPRQSNLPMKTPVAL